MRVALVLGNEEMMAGMIDGTGFDTFVGRVLAHKNMTDSYELVELAVVVVLVLVTVLCIQRLDFPDIVAITLANGMRISEDQECAER